MSPRSAANNTEKKKSSSSENQKREGLCATSRHPVNALTMTIENTIHNGTKERPNQEGKIPEANTDATGFIQVENPPQQGTHQTWGRQRDDRSTK
jgi:hypothetical protein